MSLCQPSQHQAALSRRGFGLAAAVCVLLPHQAVASATGTINGAAAAVQRSRIALLGTQIDLIVAHPEPQTRERAIEAACGEMLRLSEMMSRYRTASQVSLLARAAGATALPVAPELMRVLQQAQRLQDRSGGHFDIRVGTYSDWHFEAGATPARPTSQTLREQTQRLKAPIELDLHRGTARLTQPGLGIDLGGIAKLPILEAGLQAIQSHGISEALINGGGDVLCCGGLQGRPWRIALRNPLAPERLLGVLPLRDGVVAASGDYERGFSLNGRRYHHILDPRTGEPSQGLRGLALIASGIDAVNGWGAAMMVAGPEQSRRWLADRLQGVDAMLADDAGIWLSGGLRQRLA